MIKNIFLFVLFVVMVLGYNYVENLQTHKFCPKNLLQTFPEGLKNQGRLNSALLEQPFSFLGEGAQCYVFASQDGRYVLKLFKTRHFKPQKKWLQEGPLFYPFASSEKKEQAKQKWTRKFQESCARYTLAFERLKDETALEFLHFEKDASVLPAKFLFSGKTYSLDLSTLPFILQEKGELVPDKISSLIELGDEPAATKLLAQLREMLVERAKKGITDNRQCFSVNFGFIGNKPTQFDVGKISYEPNLDTEEEIRRVSSNLDKWVEGHFPQLKETQKAECRSQK